jgi:hypothetical protein
MSGWSVVPKGGRMTSVWDRSEIRARWERALGASSAITLGAP